MQPDSKNQTDRDAKQRQNHGLAENIGGDLSVRKAEHLDRSNLPDPFRDIYVCQIVYDDCCQRGSAYNQNGHDDIQTADRIREALFDMMRKGNRGNRSQPQQLRSQFLRLRSVRLCALRQEPGAKAENRRFSEGLFI